MNIFLAILALSFLILIHELGHFITAKLTGIKVLEFSIFMGHKIFSFGKGETKYTLRAIPIGGYVKMEGEEENSEDERAFRNKPVWKRTLVSFAGSAMNLIFGFIIFFILISSSLMPANDISMNIESVESSTPAYQAGFIPGDTILKYNNKRVYNIIDLQTFLTIENSSLNQYLIKRNDEKLLLEIDPEILKIDRYVLGFSVASTSGDDSNVVNAITPNTPAEEAGLMAGDRIILINDTEITSITDIQEFLEMNGDKKVSITVIRNDDNKILSVTPIRNVSYNIYAGYQLESEFKTGLLNNINSTTKWTVSSIRNVYYSIITILKDTKNLEYVSGPVGIINIMSSTIKESTGIVDFLRSILFIVAIISVNLGIFNLLPIPALDGSKLILLGIEKIRGKALPAEKEATISIVGFAVLILLFIFTIFNDLKKLF